MVWATPGGGGTRCSSILLDWERRMRLKKSSSGTVGPLVVEGGAAHLWSLSLEPCNIVEMDSTVTLSDISFLKSYLSKNLWNG